MNALEIFDRCMSNKTYTIDFKIYSKNYLTKVLRELEQQDEFEKCIKLKEFIEFRFNHKLNYVSYR
jgi:hypothetical protein